MIRTTAAILAVAGLVLAGVAAYSAPAEKQRPIVLLFETQKGDGASKDLAASATRAIRNYLRDTQQVEVTPFDRESATVLRAMMEKRITSDKVASYASQAERMDVAQILGFPYAAGAEISVKDLVVTVKFWVAQVSGAKPGKWETSGVSTAAGTGPLDLDNGMQSASSSAVLQIARKAFADLPKISEAEPFTGSESTAIGGARTPAVNAPTAQDYSTEADKNFKDGNYALAIQQYSRAVNADPGNPSLRLKLAIAYAARAMFDEATQELDRASKSGASPADLAAATDKVNQYRSGGVPPPAPTQPAPTQPIVTPQPTQPSAVNVTPNAIAKIIEGDKLWAQGKPDDAAQAYIEAVKLSPVEWRAYERLAIVDASMSLFGESRKVLEQLKIVQPDPPPNVVDNRYQMFRKAFDKYFQMLLRQYDSDAAAFAAKKITRESYYATINGLALRLESMAKFLDAVPVPPAKQPASLHRSLACGLMAQASASMQDYLETNADKSKTNAQTFADQARKEADAAEKLEVNTVVVKRESPPPPQPTDQSVQPPDQQPVEPQYAPQDQPQPDNGQYDPQQYGGQPYEQPQPEY